MRCLTECATMTTAILPFYVQACIHTQFIYDTVSWAVLLHNRIQCPHKTQPTLASVLANIFHRKHYICCFRTERLFQSGFGGINVSGLNSIAIYLSIYSESAWVCAIFFVISENSEKPFLNLASSCMCKVVLLCVRIQYLFNWFIHPFHNAMWKLFPRFLLDWNFRFSLIGFGFLFRCSLIYVFSFRFSFVQLIKLIIWTSSPLWMTCA